MVKWVGRLAILAAFLGIVGTIAIISYVHRNRNKVKRAEGIQKELPGSQTADTPKTKAQPQLPTAKPLAAAPAATEEVVIKKEDTVGKVLPLEKENDEKPVEPPATKTDEGRLVEKKEVVNKVDKQKEAKKDQKQNLLNQSEIRQLFIQINRVKGKYNVYSNCVQLFTTEESNNHRSARQVETFLRSHHFTIAGREMIPQKVKGIKVTPAGGCIRVTIGAL